MSRTFYAQSDAPGPTMTVGQLIEQLRQFPADQPVVFRSPLYGCFGSNTAYSVDKVTAEALERSERDFPAGSGIDEETGEPYTYEGWTDVRHAWTGVVIS